MILTFDIGNTNMVLGCFEEDEKIFVARIATDVQRTEDEYAGKLHDILTLHHVQEADITGAIISSVVPLLNSVLKKALRMLCGVEAILVGPGIKTGINIFCDDPSSVGADIITACVAAHETYGGPAVIVDMGTATKFIITDENGAFYGASIAPGLRMGLRALSGGTAQLPQISLDATPVTIGKNTADCMRSGVVLGHAAMVDGMLDRIFAETGTEAKVIATGGYAAIVTPHTRHTIISDDTLILRGLCMMYKKNQIFQKDSAGL